MAILRGFRQQYTAILMTLLVVLGGAIYWSVAFVIKQQAYETASHRVDEDVQTVRAIHQYHASELQTRAKLLASEPKVIAALGTPDIDYATVQQLAESTRASGDLDVLLINGSADWPASGTPALGASEALTRPPALAVKGAHGTAVNGVYWPGPDGGFMRLAGRDVFAVSVPVSIQGIDLGSLMIGEFAGGTYFSKFSGLIGSDVILCKFAPSDTQPQHRILASSWSNQNERAFMMEHPGISRKSFAETRRVRLSTQKADGLIRSVDLGGGVHALLFQSLAPADAAISDVMTSAAGITACLLAVSYVVIRRMSRAVAGPIQRLVDGSGKIAGGRFEARVAVEGPDELRQLSESFNAMAARLQKLYQSEHDAKQTLERRVEERTTELAQINRMLIDANEKIQEQAGQMIQIEKLAGLGTMAAGVAHELNNPLAVIAGTTELLAQDVRDDESQERLGTILKHSRRAADIIKRMLRFARTQTAAHAPCDINALVGGALELMKYKLESAGVCVTRRLAADLPEVSADEGSIEQVLINVVTNAIDAMQSGRGYGSLTVETRLVASSDARAAADAGPLVQVVISDDGPGIPAEIQKRIFDPFFTTKGIGKGTGMGLSVAHGIMEQHKGRIYLERTNARGSVFVIDLPAAPAGSHDSPAEPPVVADERKSDGLSLLVVDDEADIRHVIKMFMSVRGWRVGEASSGHAALDTLAKLDAWPDVLFVDIRMPDMSGIEFHREVGRVYGPELASRVIFVTGDTLSPEIRDFLQTSGCPKVIKPFQARDLYEAAGKLQAAHAGGPVKNKTEKTADRLLRINYS